MKLRIKQSILMEHLNYVIKGISSKNLIPILNCIKFELTNDGLYLMSTDNDIAIKTFIPKDKIDTIDICGEIVVSGKYIYEIIKKLPNELINIEEVMESKIYINTSNSSFNLLNFSNCSSNDFSSLFSLDIIISPTMFIFVKGSNSQIKLSKSLIFTPFLVSSSLIETSIKQLRGWDIFLSMILASSIESRE